MSNEGRNNKPHDNENDELKDSSDGRELKKSESEREIPGTDEAVLSEAHNEQAPQLRGLSVEKFLFQTTGDAVRAERKLEFVTAAEINDMSPETVEWIVKPWVVRGAITEVDGQVKAAGKTTWVTHMCRDVLDGTPFMGEHTLKTPVVYLTEQPKSTLRVALERAGLLGRKDFLVLFWNRTVGFSWREVMRQAVAECNRIGAKLLVIDTIAQFAGADSESSNGEALRAMEPIMSARDEALGIVLVRHERKKGGEVGHSGRGPTAFSGAVDIVLSIRRPEGKSRTTIRVIHALSRLSETPASCTIELTETGYVMIGHTQDASRQANQEKILVVLPESEIQAVPITDICDRSGAGRGSVQRVLGDDPQVGRVGSGKRGDPFRYYKKTLSAQSTPQEMEVVLSESDKEFLRSILQRSDLPSS